MPVLFKPLGLIHSRLETFSVRCLHGTGEMPACCSKIFTPMVSVQVSYFLIVLMLVFASGWPTRKMRGNYSLLTCPQFPVAPPAGSSHCLTSSLRGLQLRDAGRFDLLACRPLPGSDVLCCSSRVNRLIEILYLLIDPLPGP